MTAAELLADLKHQGFTLTPEGNRLYIVPGSRLTPKLRQAIRERKQELLTLIRGPKVYSLALLPPR